MDTYRPSPHERRLHDAQIAQIASELQRPLAEIDKLYEELLSELAPRARVTTYLPVIVARHVRDRCQRKRVTLLPGI